MQGFFDGGKDIRTLQPSRNQGPVWEGVGLWDVPATYLMEFVPLPEGASMCASSGIAAKHI